MDTINRGVWMGAISRGGWMYALSRVVRWMR